MRYGKRCKCGHGEKTHYCSDGCEAGCVGINTEWGKTHSHRLCGCKEFKQ